MTVLKTNLSTLTLPLTFGVLLLAIFSTCALAQTVVYGESVSLGEGSAVAWVEVDSENAPLRIGMTLTEGALTGLPSTSRVMSLDLPEVAVDSLYKHVMFDWAPNGHPPLVYSDYPHFDFHFYMLSELERLHIREGNDETPIAPEYMPEDYIPVPGLGTYAFPRMGVHYVDTEAPELNGQPFTKTLIYGFVDGDMIFVEPMVTVAYFESHPTDTLPIKQPEAYKRSGYYPTAYRIEYDAEGQAFDVFLTDFVLREGVVTSSEAGGGTAGAFALLPPHPNPVATRTTIDYRLDRRAHVALTVHDVLGREVVRLYDGARPAGAYAAWWDGRDGSGRRMGAGLYLVRLRAGNGVLSRQVLLMR
jgi:hypothetical protein